MRIRCCRPLHPPLARHPQQHQLQHPCPLAPTSPTPQPTSPHGPQPLAVATLLPRPPPWTRADPALVSALPAASQQPAPQVKAQSLPVSWAIRDLCSGQHPHHPITGTPACDVQRSRLSLRLHRNSCILPPPAPPPPPAHTAAPVLPHHLQPQTMKSCSAGA